MAVVVSIVSRCDLSIGAHCRNHRVQPNKSKVYVVVYSILLSFKSCLKSLYNICIVTRRSASVIKIGVACICAGIVATCIKTSKRRVALGYR